MRKPTSNRLIRDTAKAKGVYLWEIADRLGIWYSTLSQKLRKELPEGEQKRIFRIIDEIAAEHEAVDREVNG